MADLLTKYIEELNKAKAKGMAPARLNILADKIQVLNMCTYDIDTPFIERRFRYSSFELGKWERLKKFVGAPQGKKLFDTAFGSGRDLYLAKEQGYDVYGCELSEYMYADLCENTLWAVDKVVHCDMREIPLADGLFDIVRHNASFLHMPTIGAGYTTHKCLTESHRLLKTGGVLYIYVKKGQGFHAIDTGDGLGTRPFQLFNEKDLRQILTECGFTVLQVNEYSRPRNDHIIDWIEVFAKKI